MTNDALGQARDGKGVLARISVRLDEKVSKAPWGSPDRGDAGLALAILYACNREIEDGVQREVQAWQV